MSIGSEPAEASVAGATGASGGEDEALLEELGALGALGAEEAAADVDVVGDRARPGDHGAVPVERRDTRRSGVGVPPI